MTLDFLAKHGIIVGVVTMLTSFISTISSIYYICLFYCTDDEDETSANADADVNQMLKSFAISMPIFIVSCFMILGIVKKRHLFLTAWLAAAFVGALYSSGFSIFKVVTSDTVRFDDYLYIILVIGGSVIVLYPFCHLTLNIRRDRAISHLRDFKRNYIYNIINNCDIEIEKSTQCI